MKTLREYIDLIKEAQNPDWQAVIANEVKARGLPKEVYAWVGYEKWTVWGYENIFYSMDEDASGVKLTAIDDSYKPLYDDANSVIEFANSFCSGQEPDEWTDMLDQSDSRIDWDFRFKTPKDEKIIRKAAIKNDDSDGLNNEETMMYRFSYDYCENEDGNWELTGLNNCTVKWPDLEIKLTGSPPQIAEVKGTLTPATKAPAPKASVKPVAPKPAQQPPEDNQIA